MDVMVYEKDLKCLENLVHVGYDSPCDVISETMCVLYDQASSKCICF